MIIGLSGYAKSGKDTVADMIISMHKEQWAVKKFSGKLKEIASLLTGINIAKFEDQEFKESLMPIEWVEQWMDNTTMHYKLMKVRDFLQRLGTEAIRDGLHKNTWVNALMADYKINPSVTTHWFNADWDEIGQTWFVGDRADLPKECRNRYYDKQENYFYLNDRAELPNWIITDCRFPNEFRAIKDNGGIVIRIERDGIVPINAHPSETALDSFEFDFEIENNGSLEDLRRSVTFMLNKFDEGRNSI